MISLRKPLQTLASALALCAAVLLVTGCESLSDGGAPTNSPTTGKTSDLISTGDLLTITFSDTPTPMQPFEERVKDDGAITLVYNQTFKVAGKARGDVEREIRDRYVPAYYVHLTVSVKPQDRFYYVNGEVKIPSRQPYPGEMSVLKAIASAQGFTDYANKRKVRLTRASGQTFIVDCVSALENPKLDLPVYPGDKIDVPRSLWN